jgi:hypothetical protein
MMSGGSVPSPSVGDSVCKSNDVRDQRLLMAVSDVKDSADGITWYLPDNSIHGVSTVQLVSKHSCQGVQPSGA